MRPTRKTQVFFSISSMLVGLLVIPLVVLLVIFLIQPTAFSSSSSSSSLSSSLETTWNEAAGNTSSSSTSYSVALSREETWQPQPTAQVTFSNYQRGAPAPAPQIFAVDDDEGVNKTVFMSSSSSGQLDKLEASLGRARSSIREAAKVRNKTSTHQDPDYAPRGPIYRNPNAFHSTFCLDILCDVHVEVNKDGRSERQRKPEKTNWVRHQYQLSPWQQ